MFCTNCGKELTDDMVFCPVCGRSQINRPGYNPGNICLWNYLVCNVCN